MNDTSRTAEKPDSGEDPQDYGLFWKILVAVLLVWLLAHLVALLPLGLPTEKFGHVASWLSSLFGSLAFATIAYSMYLQVRLLGFQRRQMKAHREELRDIREEIEHSTAHLSLLSSALDRQNFEATFFNLMRLHQAAVDGASDGPASGADALWSRYQAFRAERRESGTADAAGAGRAMADFLSRQAVGLAPPLGILERVVSYVADSKQGDADKALWMHIVHAQLSRGERYLLYYYALADERLREAVAAHGLLAPIAAEELALESDAAFYPALSGSAAS